MQCRIVFLLSMVLFFIPTLDAAAQGEASYRILVTNDDGIEAPGIAVLAEALSGMAEVTVVAPSENRSGSSHSIETPGRQTRVTTYRRDGEIFGYAVEGTPADAVRFGLLVLGADQPFDLVISGINDGANVGIVSHLSGTVGAAMEALWHEVPAIAVSQSRQRGNDYTTAANVTVNMAKQIRDRGLLSRVMLSINVPGGEIRGTVAAPMAESVYRINYVKAKEDSLATVYDTEVSLADPPQEGGDTKAFLAGYITITSLHFDWTDYKTLGLLGDWDLSH